MCRYVHVEYFSLGGLSHVSYLNQVASIPTTTFFGAILSFSPLFDIQ
jgi:hypothetical protein